MKVVLCRGYGSPEVLKISDIPKPIPKADEILIRIQSTAVNSGDIRTRTLDVKGILKIVMRLVLGWSKPRNPILGTVFSGTVEQRGEAVTSFKNGDRVFGCSPGFKFGCYAEYITVKESTAISEMPAHANFDQAAAILFGGTTALYFLNKANPTPGQSILVYGASGAVGTSAVQVAKNRGLYVIAVSSGKNEELVRSLGADNFLDYTSSDFLDTSLQYDIVFDAVGKLSRKQLAALTRRDGKTLTVGSFDVAKETKQQLEQLKTWFDSDKFKAVIDRTYSLEEIKEAHSYVEKGHKVGNVVVKIN
ncbi:MAG: NAD(P)-dependent alcohol dehydrogenase [Clostridiaceae bacterium]